MTSIIHSLASSLNRRDEIPNQKLARQIADANDADAVRELADLLTHKNRDVQNDCIKVLYEIGNRKPSLIAAYAKNFIALLDHPNNRLQWGAMTALSCITWENPKTIYAALPKIMAAADKGSVITKDQCVNILIQLSLLKPYRKAAFPLLIDRLQGSAVNQFAMYAENALPVVNDQPDQYKKLFMKTLSERLDDLEKESQRKRIEKIIRKLS